MYAFGYGSKDLLPCTSLASVACITVVSVTHSENYEQQKYFGNVVVLQGKKAIRNEKTKLQVTMGIITLGFVACMSLALMQHSKLFQVFTVFSI